ncbi:MAG: nucleotide sugar dehydrogenase [Magnetococcales bacterium]|nr:nucleotide sugar dehydrogenase [Magnetococcales bacterium]
MKISIFGMGYVGCVSAACLASAQHSVIGVDVSEAKIALLNQGISPVTEEQLPEKMANAVTRGYLQATRDARAAIHTTDLSLITVGTPARDDGSLELAYMIQVIQEIAQALRDKTSPHTIVIRSTVPPGTTERLLIPQLTAQSGRTLNQDLLVCYNPEFLREGSSIKDFYNPPFTILGTEHDDTFQQVAQLYTDVRGAVLPCSIQAAEAMKTLCNVFHALKIAFANEAAAVLHGCGANAMEAIDLFLRDEKLNISRAYLKPGFAFGGSCLPKDVGAMIHLGQSHGVATPLLSGIRVSNDAHLERALAIIQRQNVRKIALIGIAFKPGTDDLRDSPALNLAARLLAEGYELRIFDPIVRIQNLIGANALHMQRHLPDLGDYLDDHLDRVLNHGAVWVIAHAEPGVYQQILAYTPKAPLIDLSGQFARDAGQFSYTGLCWMPTP